MATWVTFGNGEILNKEVVAMFLNLSFLVWCLVSLIFSSLFWVVLILKFRSFYFDHTQDGWKRKMNNPVRGANEEIRSKEIAYHNEAIYKDFNFYIKLTLIIIGGVVFVVTGQSKNNAIINIMLINLGGTIQFIITLIFILFIMIHQKSKIERWEIPYNILSSLLWQEFFMVTGMFLISTIFTFWFVPQIIKMMLNP